jgi:hypothetical protein
MQESPLEKLTQEEFAVPRCPYCPRLFASWALAKRHCKACPRSPRPRWLAFRERTSLMGTCTVTPAQGTVTIDRVAGAGEVNSKTKVA